MEGGALAKHSVRVLQELNRQRQEGQFCDATLAVGSLVFRAHWSVLACCSSFFQAVYHGGASGKIILPEAFLEAFTLLLDFFYTGHLAVTPDNRDRLLETAKELCIPEAIQLCQEFPFGHSESGERDGHVLNGKEPIDATLPAQTAPVEAVPPEQPALESPRASKGAQGPLDSPALLRGKLKRVPKTNVVGRAGDVKDAPECKELKRPLKSEAAEEPGARHEVALRSERAL